jgi:hypothetical protein
VDAALAAIADPLDLRARVAELEAFKANNDGLEALVVELEALLDAWAPVVAATDVLLSTRHYVTSGGIAAAMKALTPEQRAAAHKRSQR